MRLVDYPFIVVRFRCDICHRSGQSRLARLADKHGCLTTMDQLCDRITRDCPWRKDRAAVVAGCGIYLPDLRRLPVPPDLPPGMVPLRIVKKASG